MISFVFIHGVSQQTTGYSNLLFQNILLSYRNLLKRQKNFSKDQIQAQTAQFIQKEILWADITTDLTNRYL
ncbi:MAG: hypothetical protein DRP78_03180, partial [Candidatus Omnitrophota bacterium]